MSFNPNIPIITDPILQSYFQIRANFQAINAAFASNHAALNREASTAGNHTILAMQPTADPVTSASQVALYNKIVSAIPQLFYRPNSSQTPIQLTYSSISTGLASADPDVYNTDQYTFIAGPFIVYGGLLTNISDGQVVNLSPGTTLIYVDLTAANVKGFGTTILSSPIPTLISGTSFTIRNQAFTPSATRNMDAYYFAIGI